MILNAKAGGAQGQQALFASLKASGVLVVEPEGGPGVPAAAARAVQAGATLLVAAGGDGTVTSVASAILDAGSSATLAIIPLGTGNDLARTLGVPLDPNAATALIIDGVVQPIDAIRLDSRNGASWMLNMATGGSSTVTTKATSSADKRRFKMFSYVLHAWKAFKTRRIYRLRVDTDGERVRVKALNVVVANGRSCGGGFEVAPMARVDDGWLDFVAVRSGSFLELAVIALKVLTGRLRPDPKLFVRKARRLRLESRPSFALSTDGEVFHHTPIVFQVVPGALGVLVPRDGKPVP